MYDVDRTVGQTTTGVGGSVGRCVERPGGVGVR